MEFFKSYLKQRQCFFTLISNCIWKHWSSALQCLFILINKINAKRFYPTILNTKIACEETFSFHVTDDCNNCRSLDLYDKPVINKHILTASNKVKFFLSTLLTISLVQDHIFYLIQLETQNAEYKTILSPLFKKVRHIPYLH